MSYSPLMTPERSRRRREQALRMRRRRRATAAGMLTLAAIAALAVWGQPAGRGKRAGAHDSARHAAGHGGAPAPRTSPAGFTLAKPAFALSGLGTPAQDPLSIDFRTPPRSALLFDLNSGRVLWQRSPLARRHIASLTKMMTALLVVQSSRPSAHVLVTKQAVNAAGSKVGVLPRGRRVRLESMLYGLMLPSGNDAAIALAQHVSGSPAQFVTRMNSEAAQLGMGCTRYTSPSGFLDEHNYSCAADLAVLAHTDLAQRRIARVVRTYSAALPFPIKGGRLYLYNNNPLLIYHYPGTTGLKTGFTQAAGRCLVATATRHGVSFGVVLLDSPAPGTQARQLLDRAFAYYGQAPVAEPPIPPQA